MEHRQQNTVGPASSVHGSKWHVISKMCMCFRVEVMFSWSMQVSPLICKAMTTLYNQGSQIEKSLRALLQ